MGDLGFALTFTAMMGAQRPATRFRKEAIPVPVPRTGAGKISGVYAKRTWRDAFSYWSTVGGGREGREKLTPYDTFWNRASKLENVSW